MHADRYGGQAAAGTGCLCMQAGRSDWRRSGRKRENTAFCMETALPVGIGAFSMGHMADSYGQCSIHDHCRYACGDGGISISHYAAQCCRECFRGRIASALSQRFPDGKSAVSAFGSPGISAAIGDGAPCTAVSGLAGLFCWWEDRPVVTGKNLKKYGGLFLLLLAGMGLSLGADALAYGKEWKEFRQLFNDRTTIYDFYPEVVTDDAYAADLEEMGAWYGARVLLENYNYGLDETVDAQLLADVAAYAKERVGGARDWGRIFREKLQLYRYRSFHGEDAPYHIIVWLAYAANMIAAVILYRRKAGKSCGMVVQLLLVFLVRTALWMFILLRGRDPERITHPLYLVEFCLLAGMFLRYLRESAVRGPAAKAVDAAGEPSARTADLERAGSGVSGARKLICGAAAALCLLSVVYLIKAIPAVWEDRVRRQEINADREAIDAYCRARPDTFYFEDVYSTVAFSERLLECRDNTLSNYDIAGGWMCKSPLYREKLAAFGIENAVDALAQGRADFIMSDEEISLRGLVWLEIPFAQKDMKVYIEEYDRIGEHYGVYRIIPISENG